MLSVSVLLTLFVFACCSSVALSVQGELVSCPACKLNRLPEVRRFFKEPGHADSYANVKITFISGRNPDLFIKNEQGETIEKIDLSPMTTEQIHELMVSKGFERKAAGKSSSLRKR